MSDNMSDTENMSIADRESGLEHSPSPRPFVTIVTPAFNEAENLPELYQCLRNVLDNISVEWEWIVVDDHSTDETFAILTRLAEQDERVHGFRFSRNFGSHMAITCGLNHAQGECAIAMAADLQDPPEALPNLLAKWHEGAEVVWAVRAHREGEKASTLAFARLYYFLMRHIVGIKEIPATGADFFLIDRCVLDAFRQFKESNLSIPSLISWMGFRQTTITYTKRARMKGRSGWSFRKKFKLVLDSIMSFSYLPIRLMSYVGIAAALLGFVYAGVVIANALSGKGIEGWSSLMVVVLVFGGMQMVMMGVLGEYLWRALSEARQRPRYIIEAILGQHK